MVTLCTVGAHDAAGMSIRILQRQQEGKARLARLGSAGCGGRDSTEAMGVWKTVTPPSSLLGGCLLARTSKQIFAILGSWSLIALAGVLGWEVLDLSRGFPWILQGSHQRY